MLKVNEYASLCFPSSYKSHGCHLRHLLSFELLPRHQLRCQLLWQTADSFSLRKASLYSAHSARIWPIMTGRTRRWEQLCLWLQDCQAAAHISSAGRNQRGVDGFLLPLSPFIQSKTPISWICPHSGWVLPQHLNLSRMLRGVHPGDSKSSQFDNHN